MAMQMSNLKVTTMAPTPCKTKLRQKDAACCKLKNTISCRANNKLAVQKGKNNNNLYEVLSLRSENIGFDEIKKAYRRMAREFHPDVWPSSMKEESTKRFVEIQKAYETLSDPISRKMYDYEMGFVDSLGFICLEKRQEIFPREVWEKQLCGLKQRSRIRMEMKKR